MIDIYVHYSLIGADRCRKMGGSKSFPEEVILNSHLKKD